jgi:hypothetical protein
MALECSTTIVGVLEGRRFGPDLAEPGRIDVGAADHLEEDGSLLLIGVTGWSR